MTPTVFLRAVLPPLLLLCPLRAPAQHLYLDANGDGRNTGADTLSTSGPTEVAVWLRTDANRDGTPASCGVGPQPLTMNSYQIILRAIGGTVAWSDFRDDLGYAPWDDAATSGTDFYVGRGGATLDPGLHRLCTLTVTVTGGAPVIDILESTPLTPTGFTAFGSSCSGRDLDNTLKFPTDWHDVDGLGTGRSIHPPVLARIADMSVVEGGVATQTITATDADGDPIDFAKAGGPPFLSVETLSRDPLGAEGRIRLAPGFQDAGTYQGVVQAGDGAWTDAAVFAIVVEDATGPLQFLPLPNVVLFQHADTLLPITAVSPGGGTVQLSLAEGPSYATVQNVGARGLRLRPRLHTDVGTARAIVAMTSSTAAARDTVEIEVLPHPLPPSLSAWWGTAAVGVELALHVEVSDPENDPIASLVADTSALPAGDPISFTTTAENRLATLLWTPSAAGVFPVRLTAADATGQSATEELAIAVPHGSPRITAPRTVRARPLEPVAFDVTAASPDGAPVTSLRLLGNATTSLGATFTVDPSRSFGTYAWTPPVDGAPNEGATSFDLTFQAVVDADSGTATTILELTRTDVDTLRTEALDLIVSGAGQAGVEPLRLAPGLTAPPGSGKTLLHGLGPWIVGKSDGAIRAARGGGDTEFAPGTAADGAAAPYDPRFRLYRLTRGDATASDYLGWPVADGAPVTPAGTPLLFGRSQLWSVAQDVAPVARANAREYEAWSDPIPVELRQTAFVYDDASPLGGMIFFRYAFTYRGAVRLDSVYVAVWADPDLGNPHDDLAGYDRALEMGFVYNALDVDGILGIPPPALGIVWLGRTDPGAPPLGVGAFQVYTTSEISTHPLDPTRSFLLAQGKHLTGDPMTVTGDKASRTTTYRYDGDPLTGTGWRDDWSQNKRILLAAGPLSLAPNETVSYAAALLLGRGTDRLSAVGALRDMARRARAVADGGFVPEPFLDAPSEVPLLEGQPFALRVTALDPDGDPLTAIAADLSGLPSGHAARFDADAGFGGGTLSWTPPGGSRGDYPVRFTASNDRSASVQTTLRVRAANHPPTVHAGGPYAGVVGEPLAFSAALSRDADGDRLFGTWHFGDGSTGHGLQVLHRYDAVGLYVVTAEVTDGLDIATDKTTATITEEGRLRAWTPETANVLPLASARSHWVVRIEPFPHTFALGSIGGPLRLVRHDGGARREAVEDLFRRGAVGDADGNGAADRAVFFALEDVRRLFDDAPAGASTWTLTLEGTVDGGGAFATPLTVAVHSPPALRAQVSPNPVRRDGVLVVRTTRAGRVRAVLHDVRGRRVRVLDGGDRPPGIQAFAIDGRDGSGRTLPSGVYFYRIETSEGIAAGRVMLLR